jgi:hypothetical protein
MDENHDPNFKPYAVIASNSPTQRFTDVKEAARAFARIPVNRLPRVELRQRGTIQIGGQTKPKVTTTLIAGTRMEGSLPVRRFTKAAPQDFRDAVEAVRNQTLGGPNPGEEAAPTQTVAQGAVQTAAQAVTQEKASTPRAETAPAPTTKPEAPTVTQTGNSIEPAASQRPDYQGQDIGKVTFSKTTAGNMETYRVRLYGADGKTNVADEAQVAKADLVGKFGAEVAHAITAAKGRSGTVKFDGAGQTQQAAPPQQTAAPAQNQSASQAAAPVQAQAQAQPTAKPANSPQQSAADAAKEAQEQRRMEIVASLAERFTVKGNAYHFKGQGERKAFEDMGSRLSTDHSTGFVVRGMLDLAESKGWTTVHLNGTDEFRREAWLQASQRGLKPSGYEPTTQDQQRLAELQQRHPQQGRNAADPGSPQAGAQSPQDQQRQQLLDVIKASMRAGNVPPEAQATVLAEANKHMDWVQSRGESLPRVRVKDHTAPSQKQQPMPNRADQHQHQRVRH